MKGERITVTTTATLIASGDKGSHGNPVRVLIKLPSGGQDVDLGGSDVVFGEGYALESGEGAIGADLVHDEDIYGIVTAGTQVVHVLRNGV